MPTAQAGATMPLSGSGQVSFDVGSMAEVCAMQDLHVVFRMRPRGEEITAQGCLEAKPRTVSTSPQLGSAAAVTCPHAKQNIHATRMRKRCSCAGVHDWHCHSHHRNNVVQEMA